MNVADSLCYTACPQATYAVTAFVGDKASFSYTSYIASSYT